MKLRLLCLVSILVAVASLFVRWHVKQSHVPPDLSFVIDDHLNPVYLDSIGPAEPGVIHFEGETGETVHGCLAATLFADREGRPVLGPITDATGVQIRGKLHLRRWIEEQKPQGLHYLHTALLISRDGEHEVRTAWVRIDVGALAVDGMRIAAPRRRTLVASVLSTDGVPVPGALAALDRSPRFATGLISAFGYTGEDGRVRFSGIDDTEHWIVRLPDGVGPYTAALDTACGPDAADVEFRIASMRGDWEFHRHEIGFELPGGSTRIELESADSGSAAQAWMVSSWVGPGRGRRAPLYVMTRPGDEPLPSIFRFAGHAAREIENVREPVGLHLAGPTASAESD